MASKTFKSTPAPTKAFSSDGNRPIKDDYDQSIQYAAQAAAMGQQNASNQVSRDKEIADYADNVSARAARRDLDLGTTAANNNARLKLENDREQNSFKSSESEKDRQASLFASNASNASNNAGTFDTNITQKEIAKIQGRNELAGQRSSVEQAKIAAQSQITSAIMGNRGSYGGYW